MCFAMIWTHVRCIYLIMKLLNKIKIFVSNKSAQNCAYQKRYVPMYALVKKNICLALNKR